MLSKQVNIELVKFNRTKFIIMVFNFLKIIDIFIQMDKGIFKKLSFKIIAITLLLMLVSANSIVVAHYICSHNHNSSSNNSMEHTGCCCHNEYSNTNQDVKLTRTDCGCCITQGQPINNSLPPVTISTNKLITSDQYAVISDINNNNLYSSDIRITALNIPLITQDITILNANLRI